MHFLKMQVKFGYQGHEFKVGVTGAIKLHVSEKTRLEGETGLWKNN